MWRSRLKFINDSALRTGSVFLGNLDSLSPTCTGRSSCLKARDIEENKSSGGFKANLAKLSLPERIVSVTPGWLKPHLEIVRLHKPAGTWLLYIPCTWSICLAADAGCLPSFYYLSLFGCGALIMRGAGCIINDIWDKDFDKAVERTRSRPLASESLTMHAAICNLVLQLSLGLIILLQLNWFCIMLGFASMGLVISYPLFKRFTYWPQLALGLTFNWGALMGWTAVKGYMDWSVCLPLYTAGICWTLYYDTVYAHQDKTDDSVVGIKSLALKLGDQSKQWFDYFGGGMISSLTLVGILADQSWPYFFSVFTAGGFIANQIPMMESFVTKLDEDFRLYLEVASSVDSQNLLRSLQGARVGINLFSKFPIARDAVLEHYSVIFLRILQKFVDLKGRDLDATDEDVKAAVAFIETLRINLKKSPTHWSSILTTWSLDLLGRLSRVLPPSSLGYGVTGQLQSYQEIIVTKALLDLADESFEANLSHGEASSEHSSVRTTESFRFDATCVKALVMSSEAYGEAFDWVVAHLGGKYPSEIIPKLLDCGLRVHATFFERNQPHSSADLDQTGLKIRSVVSIIDHLSLLHYGHIVEAVVNFAKVSAKDKSGPGIFFFPFILLLGDKSRVIRQVTSDCLLRCLDEILVGDLWNQSRLWFHRSSKPVNAEEMWDLFVRLLIRYGPGSSCFWTPPVLFEKFIKTCIVNKSSYSKETILGIRIAAFTFLDRLRNELIFRGNQDKGRGRSHASSSPDLLQPLFSDLGNHWSEMLPLLFVFSELNKAIDEEAALNMRNFAIDVLGGLTPHDCSSYASEAIQFLLKLDISPVICETIIRIIVRVQGPCPDAVLVTVTSLLKDLRSDTESDRKVQAIVLENLLQLIAWEKETPRVEISDEVIPLILRATFTRALTKNVTLLAALLWDSSCICRMLDLLCILPLKTEVKSWSPSALSYFVESIVEAFFRLLSWPEELNEKGMQKLTGINICNEILADLIPQCPERNPPKSGSTNPEEKSLQFDVSFMAVRFVIDRTFSHNFCQLIGGMVAQDVPIRKPLANNIKHSLLEENLRLHSGATDMVRIQSTLYRSSCLGHGNVRNEDRESVLPCDIGSNQQHVLDFLMTILEVNGQALLGGSTKAPHPTSWKYLADLLVEHLAPDVMFSDVPWPDEDAGRVTIEHDIEICRRISANPISWHLLLFIARNQAYTPLTAGENSVTCVPPICYCSAILRAISCVCLHHWSSTLEASGGDCPQQSLDTKRLILILSQSNLCPPPMSMFGEILDLLPPAQIRAFMSDWWAYLREMLNTPIALARTLSAYNDGLSPAPPSPAVQQCVQRLRLIFLANMDKLGPYYMRFFGLPGSPPLKGPDGYPDVDLFALPGSRKRKPAI